MKNLQARLVRLEQSVKAAVPFTDWTQTAAFAALSDAEKQKMRAYTERFNKDGLSEFSDDELDDFETLLLPFAKEEREEGNGR